MATFGLSTLTQSWVTSGELISYSETDYNNARYDLLTASGGIAESTYVDSGIKECTATWSMPCGASLGSLTLGTGGLAEVSISTSNGDWPQVTIKWYTGLPTCASGETYALTVPTWQPKRLAQALGFTAGSNSEVQSGSWTATASLNLLLGTDAEPAAYAFSGGISTASCEIVGTATVATGYTLTNAAKSESNTTYQSMSYTAEKILSGTAVTSAS